MKILLIEDDRKISKALEYILKSEGYDVTVCGDCSEAYAAAADEYGLMIIDVTLPDGNGFDLYSQISRVSRAPVIFLTALDDEDSVVRGFDLGADDYITKPFSTRELLARIGRFKRKEAADALLSTGDIVLDLAAHTVKKGGEPVELTALEYRIFLMMMQNMGQIVTREAILEKIWDLAGNFVNDNTLTVYIRRIRAKIGTDVIKTVKGIGYRVDKL